MDAAVSGENHGAFSGAFFSYGFRPFFLAAGCYAPIAILDWLGVLAGWWSSPNPASPIWWHGHEMVFGWAVAAVCGFLLIRSEIYLRFPFSADKAAVSSTGLVRGPELHPVVATDALCTCDEIEPGD